MSLLVLLVDLIDAIPSPAVVPGRGRPPTYSDRLFLKAVVIMLVRDVSTVDGLLAILAQPAVEMQALRQRLTSDGRFPSRRTWERRLNTLPGTLPARIACLGAYLVAQIQPWETSGRAVAIDSTVLQARGGVWHKKHRDAGEIPHISIDTEAHWTKSGWHGWVYGWKLHLVTAVAAVWIPLAAELTPANAAASLTMPHPPISRAGSRLRGWDVQIATDLSSQQLVDLAMARDGRGLARGPVHVEGVTPTFAQQDTPVAFKVT